MTVRPTHRKNIKPQHDVTLEWLCVCRRADGIEKLFSRHPPDAAGKTAAARNVVNLRRSGLEALLQRHRPGWTPTYLRPEGDE